MLEPAFGPCRFWTQVLPGTTSSHQGDLHRLFPSCICRGRLMTVGHPVGRLGRRILQTTAIVPASSSRASLKPVHSRRSFQRSPAPRRTHRVSRRAVQTLDLHRVLGGWRGWLLYRHLLLRVDEPLHGDQVSRHAAFVRLLLFGIVPNPVNVVWLFEGFHLKVGNLRGFRWSVGWGVSNFRLHSGCVNVLEGTRSKPENNYLDKKVKHLSGVCLAGRVGSGFWSKLLSSRG